MELTNQYHLKSILIAIFLFIIAQSLAWLQFNLQFKFPDKFGPNWWGYYIIAIPITACFLWATRFGVQGLGGSLWANRFIGFAIGIIIYGILTQIFFNQPVTPKVLVQILLAIMIMVTQFILK
jgi:hypothetical protein